MPGEHRVVLEGLLGQQLVVVDHHAGAAELLGDRGGPPLVHVALPGREVAAGQHHVDDRVVGRVAPVVAGHVAVVLAGHLDLTAQEAVVVDLQLGHLLVGQESGEVDVALFGELPAMVVADGVLDILDRAVVVGGHRFLLSRQCCSTVGSAPDRGRVAISTLMSRSLWALTMVAA